MKIVSVEIVTDKFQAQVEFYGGGLGLWLVHLHGGRARFEIGESFLDLVQGERPAGIYHLAINIPENQIEASRSWLGVRADLVRQANGDPIVSFGDWNSQSIYFWDADGNILELIARHALPNASCDDFGVESLLEISEVGLPVSDVRGTVHRLTGQFELETYRGEGSEDFAAVGDEHGLLIVVLEGRPWFLTDSPARTLPMKVMAIQRESPFEVVY